MMTASKFKILVSSALFLVGCSATVTEMDEGIEEVQQEVNKLNERWQSDVSERKLSRVKIVDRVNLMAKVEKRHFGEPLPEKFKVDGKALYLPRPATLSEVANELRNVHGIIVTVDDQPRAARNIDIEGEEDSGALLQRRRENDFESDEIADVTERINLKGSYREIFDHIASIYQFAWEYENDVVRFRKYLTEVFELNALAGEQLYDASVGNSSSGGSGEGSGGSAGNLSTSVSLTINAYDDVINSLENSILPPDATAEALPGTGGIVVTAPAWAMNDIRRFIEQENNKLSRTAAVEVAIYSVTRDKRNSSASSIDLAVRDLSDRWGVSFRNSGFTGSAEGSSFVGNIFSVPLGNSVNISDTQIVAESFKRVGRTSSQLNGRSFVKPNKPVVFTTGNEKGYTKNVSIIPIGTDQVNNLAQGTDNETLETGFSLGLRGKVSDQGIIYLNLRWSIRDLVQLDELINGTQAPDIDKTEGDEDIELAPGETVILRSFTRTGNRVNEQKGGNVLCTFFCEDTVGEGEIQEFFVVVHADLLARPKPLLAGR